MKIKTERGYLMINEKEKEIKELAKEIEEKGFDFLIENE